MHSGPSVHQDTIARGTILFMPVQCIPREKESVRLVGMTRRLIVMSIAQRPQYQMEQRRWCQVNLVSMEQNILPVHLWLCAMKVIIRLGRIRHQNVQQIRIAWNMPVVMGQPVR